MKRKDIKAGIVYAEETPCGSPSALVFLEDAAATVWLSPYQLGSRELRYIACRQGEKPKRRHGIDDRSQGYAAVSGPAEALEGLDCKAELERFKTGSTPSADGLRFLLVFSLGIITGPYAERAAAWEARQDAERRARAEARQERAEEDARAERIIAGLKEHGLTAGTGSSWTGRSLIALPLDDAERLLSMLTLDEIEKVAFASARSQVERCDNPGITTTETLIGIIERLTGQEPVYGTEGSGT